MIDHDEVVKIDMSDDRQLQLRKVFQFTAKRSHSQIMRFCYVRDCLKTEWPGVSVYSAKRCQFSLATKIIQDHAHAGKPTLVGLALKYQRNTAAHKTHPRDSPSFFKGLRNQENSVLCSTGIWVLKVIPGRIESMRSLD